MTELTLRDVRLHLAWCFASALVLATTLWCANALYMRVLPDQLWQVGVVILVGAAAVGLPQQVILLREGHHAWMWAPVSLAGCLLLSVLGLCQDDAINGIVGRNDFLGDYEYPVIMPPLFYGSVFGCVQLLGCRELRQKPLIWIVANAVALPSIVYILTFQRRYSIHNYHATYLIGLAAGAVYGVITGGAVVLLRLLSRMPANAEN